MKKTLSLFILFTILLSMFASFSYADTEKSETLFLDVKNVNATNNIFVYEIDAPKDFNELLSHKFASTGTSKVEINKVDYDKNRNKLLLTFNFTEGAIKTVKGYVNKRGTYYNKYGGHAVCRYSDGVRWQINEYSKDNRLVTRIYDYSKQITGGSIPYEFYFGKIRMKSMFEPNLDITPAYWEDENGTSYSNSQIIPNTKKVLPSDIKYPTGMNIELLEYKEPKQYFYFTANPLTSVKDFESNEATMLTPNYQQNLAMTGYAECHQYSFRVFYKFTAQAKANDIIGTFNYKYKKTDEPKIITTIEANPSSVKFNNQTINVQVTLKAEVTNIKAGAIKEYKVFLRTEDNTQNPQPLGYKKSGNSLTATVTDTFTIPVSKLSNVNDYTEYFVGRAYATLSNGTTLMSDLVKTSTYVYKGQPPVVEEINHEIVAKINGDKVVKKGDDTTFNAYGSYSTGSTIEGIKWYLENAMIQPSDTYVADQYTFTTWYDQLGTQRAIVQVKDKENRQAWAYMDFEVVEPTIEVSISHTGTRKENRKVTIHAYIDTPTRYPLTEITWSVQSLTGTLNNQIKHEANLSGKTSFDVLFKQAGEYLITANVKNSAGYTNQATYVIEIEEDKPPQVDFDFQQKVYRDPSNNNMATYELTDYSYSYDGDYIKQRNWYVIFDSNNDGIFNEARVLFNTGNNKEVTYSTNHVGKYRFILEAIEEFGEPTIDQYVTESDRRSNNTEAW